MTSNGEAGWRWRNVPVPEAHVGGLVVGAALEWLRPWGLPRYGPLVSVLGLALLLVGVGVVAWAVRTVGRQAIESPTALVTDGPYRSSRNPMYLGWTAGYLGVALLVDLPWALVLLPAVLAVVHRQVGREERALERRFGDEYRRYRRAVRRYL